MEKERGSKLIAIVALVIAVIGLSVGFAAYTSTLSISNTSATVGASSESDFRVVFSTTNTGTDDTTIANLITTAQKTGNAQPILSSADGVTPSMSGTTINGLSASFTEPGESVTYTLYSHNVGKFAAYLNSLTIGEKTCVANTGTTQSLVNDVCPSISMSVKVGNQSATVSSLNNIDNHTLDIDDYETIVITLSYGETDKVVDGDFTVNFGQINLTYDHLDSIN